MRLWHGMIVHALKPETHRYTRESPWWAGAFRGDGAASPMLEALTPRSSMPALAIDRQTIETHPAAARTRHFTRRQLDRPAKQQKFLGQGGWFGVRAVRMR